MEIKEKQIRELAVGEKVDMYAVVTLVKEREAVNGSQFVDMVLEDKTGALDIKLWDMTLDDLAKVGAFSPGTLVKVRGQITEWQGKKQLTVDKNPQNKKQPYLRMVKPEDGQNMEDYVRTAPIEAMTMYKQLVTLVNKFENQNLKALAGRMLQKNKEKLLYYPAAQQVHHAYRGGLLYHIHSMVKMASLLAGRYPNLNMELLLTGVIVHDMGKVEELSANEMGKTEDYTQSGKLLGHAIIGIKMLNEMADEVDTEVLLLVEHMIASHHFSETWGAYQKPAFLEAELLHHLDMLDSRASMVEDVVENLEPGTFSSRQSYLERREIYRHTL